MKIAFFIPDKVSEDQRCALNVHHTDSEETFRCYLQRQYGAHDIFFQELLLDKPFSEGDVALAASDAFKLGRQYEREQNRKRVNEAEDILD